MALVVEAEHTVVACAVLHTAMVVVVVVVEDVVVASAAAAVAAAVREPVTVEAVGLVAAYCDAVLVRVETEYPSRGSIHSIRALLL